MESSQFGKNFSQIENVQIINTCFLDNKIYLETGIFYACYPEGSRDFISFAERLFQKSWHIMETLMDSLTW